MSELQDVLESHPAYENIERDEYMAAWDGGQPLLDLVRERDNCRVFVDDVSDTDGDFVMDIESDGPDAHYRISPSGDIEDSLAALEEVGFEHFTPEPPQPGEAPFQQVFAAVEEAGDD